MALGSSIQRKKSSNKTASIVTCIDQSELDTKLIYEIDGETYKIKSEETIHIASSRNKTFYYFARCQDGEWAGEAFREFKGKTYGFNKIKNPQSSFADLIYVLTGNQ